VGAEFLPGHGAFLRVEGMEVRRFQGYYVADTDSWIRVIQDRWYAQTEIAKELERLKCERT
jgi:hypothetical protein